MFSAVRECVAVKVYGEICHEVCNHGTPSAASVFRAQSFTQGKFMVHSVPKIRTFLPENIDASVTGVIKAASESIHAIMLSFVYKSIKKLLHNCRL